MHGAKRSTAHFFLNLVPIVTLLNFAILGFELSFAHTFLDFLLLEAVVIDGAGGFFVLEQFIRDVLLMMIVTFVGGLGGESAVGCLVFGGDSFDSGGLFGFEVGARVLIEYFFVIGQGSPDGGNIFFQVIEMISSDSTNRGLLFALLSELSNL